MWLDLQLKGWLAALRCAATTEQACSLRGRTHSGMLDTEGEVRARFAKEVSAQHFADTARARQDGEAAAGTADSRTTRCYQLVRPSVLRRAACVMHPIS